MYFPLLKKAAALPINLTAKRFCAFKCFCVLWLGLILIVGFWGPVLAKDGQRFDLERFIDPQVCGDCHHDIYQQWRHSTHNMAHKDPIYREVATYHLRGLTDKNELQEAEACVKCHVPVGVITGFPEKTSQDILAEVPALARQGVQCDYCHSVTRIEKMYNNGLVLSPGYGEIDPGIKRGPRQEAESFFHESRYSQIHTQAGICGTCHNVKHVVFKTDLETTYEEWADSPYNHKDPGQRVTCQGCHMYQRPGVPATGSTKRPKNPGRAAASGPRRDHVFTHNFVGANGTIPALFGDSAKRDMATERLQKAACLSLDTTRIKQQELVVQITNCGAGHDLPTGLTHARQMWLQVTVAKTDGAGDARICYTSGHPDENGYLPEGAVLFNTVFGDGQEQPVINIAKAREILKDKRIPAKATATERFTLPAGIPDKNLEITVKLCYRSFPQKIMDQVAGEKAMTLPIITMASIQKRL